MFKAKDATSCIVLSIPRSGTHFLMKTLNLMGLEEYAPPGGIGVYNLNTMPPKGHYEYGGHFVVDMEPVWLSKLAGYKGLYITRDLRDVIVSHALFAIKDAKAQGGHPLYPVFNSGNMDEAIDFLIETTPLRYWAREAWKAQPHVKWIKYEDLLLKPFVIIKDIAEWLNIEIHTQEINGVVAAMRPGCGGEADRISEPYFRKGVVGDWKLYFTEEHKRKFKQFSGQILLRDEYETDLNW